MALLTVGAELALMNVGVTVLAALPHVGEHWFYVTLDTGDVLVHAAQWVACLVVVELGNGTDRLPAFRRVAVLAGNIQASVRTVTSGVLVGPTRKRGEEKQQRYC